LRNASVWLRPNTFDYYLEVNELFLKY